MILAIIGAVVLVLAFLPIINPGLLGREHYRDGMRAWNYLTAVIAVIVLSISWYFNKKAQRLRKDVQPTSRIRRGSAFFVREKT